MTQNLRTIIFASSLVTLTVAAVMSLACARSVVPEKPAVETGAPAAASGEQAQELTTSPDGATVKSAPVPKEQPKEQPLFSEVVPPGPRLLLAWTAAVQGYVAPCGCTGDPLGGVARLSAALDQARAAYGERVLFVDAGGLFFEPGVAPLAADACQIDARTELLLSTYARQNLAATIRGPLDDLLGAAWRDEKLAAADIVTLATAGDIRPGVASAKTVRSLTKKIGDVVVGLIGFSLFPQADKTNTKREQQIALEISAAAKELREKGARLVVVLAQAKRPSSKRILMGTTSVDVALQGHAPGELPAEPERVGTTLLLASGQQAQYLGFAAFDLEGLTAATSIALDDRAGKKERRLHLLDERVRQYGAQVAETEEGSRRDFIASRLARVTTERDELRTGGLGAPPSGPHVTIRSVALRRGSAEEDTAKKALAVYEASIPELTKTCEANVVCPEAKEGAATYVGVETCFQCHRGAVKFWRQQKVEGVGKDNEGHVVKRTLSHANAWDTLVHDGKESDRSCVGCHSIGFNESGGYCKTSEVDFRTDVQCEACHGPASLHVESGGDPNLITNKNIDETTCRRCHHVPHIETSESFVFDDKLLHILGEGHGEKRRQEIPTAPR